MEIIDGNLLLVSPGLVTAAVAWFAYLYKWEKDKIDTPGKILRAVEEELSLIKSWTGAYPDTSKDDYQKRKEYDEFYLPSRQVFEFDYPTIKNITDKEIIEFFSDDFIKKMLSLNQAISNFQQYHSRLEKVAMSNPQLYASILVRLNKDKERVIIKNYTKEQRDYMEMIYRYNYKLHHDFIGGDWKKDGLHSRFKNVISAMRKEKKKKWSIPFQFQIFNMLALIFFVAGALIILYHLIEMVSLGI